MSKRWYAVQHGDELDCGDGSTVKREARKMATALHKAYPSDEIRIVYCTTDSDYCEDIEIVYGGRK